MTAGGANTYTWSPGTGLSATTGSTVVYSASTSTASPVTFTVTGTGTNACTNTLTSSYTVYQSPAVTVNSATICARDSANLTVSGTASTYAWSPATGLNSTSNASVKGSPSSTTVYTVVGIATFRGPSCSSSATSTITVNPLPSYALSNKQAANNFF